MKSYSRKWEEKEKEPFTFLTIRKRIVYDENATPRFIYKVAPFPKISSLPPTHSTHTPEQKATRATTQKQKKKKRRRRRVSKQ